MSAELGTAAWHQCQKLLQQPRPRLSLGLSPWSQQIPISIHSTIRQCKCMALVVLWNTDHYIQYHHVSPQYNQVKKTWLQGPKTDPYGLGRRLCFSALSPSLWPKAMLPATPWQICQATWTTIYPRSWHARSRIRSITTGQTTWINLVIDFIIYKCLSYCIHVYRTASLAGRHILHRVLAKQCDCKLPRTETPSDGPPANRKTSTPLELQSFRLDE